MTATTDTEPGTETEPDIVVEPEAGLDTEPASKLRPAERVVNGYRKLRPAERVVNGYRKLRPAERVVNGYRKLRPAERVDDETEPTSKHTLTHRVVDLSTNGYRKLRPADRVVNGYRKLRRTNKHAAATVHELGVLREELKHTAAGWVVPGRETNPEAVLSLSLGDSPPFVCKELALRYGLVQLSAYVDYDRLCDSTGQPDATKRIARITEYLDEMDQLRNLERRIQPLLPEDADTRQALIDD